MRPDCQFDDREVPFDPDGPEIPAAVWMIKSPPPGRLLTLSDTLQIVVLTKWPAVRGLFFAGGEALAASGWGVVPVGPAEWEAWRLDHSGRYREFDSWDDLSMAVMAATLRTIRRFEERLASEIEPTDPLQGVP